MLFLIHNPQTNLRRAAAGVAPVQPPAFSPRGKLAVIPVVGVLTSRMENFWFSCGTTYDYVSACLDKYAMDDSIAGVVLDVDSPGGAADGVFELAEKIRAFPKPVVSYARGLAASAAYILFSAAHHTIAHRTALLGSVGAYECYYSEGDIKYIVSSQSPKKILDVNVPEDAAVAQARVDQLAEMFITDLAKYVGVTTAQVLSD